MSARHSHGHSDTVAYGICFFRRAIDPHHMLPSTYRYCHPAAVAYLLYTICCRRDAAVVALLIHTICYRRTFNFKPTPYWIGLDWIK